MQNLYKKIYQYIKKNKYKVLIATIIIFVIALFININIRLKAAANIEILEKKEQKILGVHTQNLKTMLTNYEVLPDSKKKEYQEEIIKGAKARSKILQKLLAKNPDSIIQHLISNVFIDKIPQNLAENIEEEITLTGKITINENDPLNKDNTKKGEIELDKTKFAVYFTGIQPRPKNGTIIKIEGVKIGNNIISSGYQVYTESGTSGKKINNSSQLTTGKSKTNTIKITVARPINNSFIGDENAILIDASAQSFTRIEKIKIYIDNTLVKTCNVTNFCSHWWKIENLPNGTHVITVEAQDLSSPQQTKIESVALTKK